MKITTRKKNARLALFHLGLNGQQIRNLPANDESLVRKVNNKQKKKD